MIVVGFYKGHNATACILKDGKIVAAASEERFIRIKNADVFPIQAIRYCLKEVNVRPQDVDYYVRTYTHPEGFVSSSGETKMPPLIQFLTVFLLLARKLILLFPFLISLGRFMYEIVYTKLLSPRYQDQFRETMSAYLKIDKNKIIFADHHICHAYAVYYGFVPQDRRGEDFLVVTLDGAGDGDCGGVWVIKEGAWKRIAQTPAGASLALFYGMITQYLGMKLNEHEYKVMGLAPYVSSYEVAKVYPLFKDLFWVDENLIMHSKILSSAYLDYFDKILKRKRFDAIAGAAQKYVEDISIDLVKKAIKKTGIKNLAVAGGFFMNVKANKKIAENTGVKSFFPCPTSSDESAVFGAAYFGYELLCKERNDNFNPQNVERLYLGGEFNEKDIRLALSNKGIKKKYGVKKIVDMEKKIASLLAEGKIVGRLKGKMEWGARALGNRSILMDPRRKDLVRVLNEQIKSRDFWMPFAASILDTYEEKYIVNPKGINAEFMIIGFDTTPLGKKDLPAAIHPYDFTCRPQIVRKNTNADYWWLIKYFEEKTGVGAVLNTSFNLHGEPIVYTPFDALSVFERCDLEYLALGDYLIWKK